MGQDGQREGLPHHGRGPQSLLTRVEIGNRGDRNSPAAQKFAEHGDARRLIINREYLEARQPARSASGRRRLWSSHLKWHFNPEG
jgi:hypothetical protein